MPAPADTFGERDDDAAREPPGALPIGMRLAHFVIDRVIASGDYGFVYLASDTLLARKVAIKEYFPRSLCTRDAAMHLQPRAGASHGTIAGGREAFVEEARLLSRLDHPGLVQVLAAFEAHHTAYRVMPYHEGVTLAQARRRQHQIPGVARLTALMRELLAPVQALHQASVVHGYLHPEQVMVLPDERLLLLGFGTARRALHGPLDHAYAPLEQSAMGGHLPRGAWTDLYSVAALTWFFATGRAPVASTERNAGVRFNAGAELAKVLQLVPDDDPQGAALVGAVDRALALVPTARWQSAAQLRQELERMVSHEKAADAAEAPLRAEPHLAEADLDPSVRSAIARAVESIPESEPLWPERQRHVAHAVADGDVWQTTRPGVPETEVAEHDSVPWHASRADPGSSRMAPPVPKRSSGWIWALSAVLVALGGAAAWRWSETAPGESQLARLTELLPQEAATPAKPAASVPPPSVAVAPAVQPVPAAAPVASAAEAVAVAAPASAPVVVVAPAAVTPPAAVPAASAAPARDLMAERALPPPAAGALTPTPRAETVVAAVQAPVPPPQAQEPRAQAPTPERAATQRTTPRVGTRADGALPWDPLESTCRHASLSIL